MRALLIVLDSVGVGNAPDAESYGDVGANTLGHIFEQRPDLALPNLCSLGLKRILPVAGDAVPGGFVATSRASRGQRPQLQSASYGRMQERSAGKDTTTGHWEIAGALLEEPFATFKRFPNELVQPIERDAGVQFIGNYAASGTTVLEELGREHVATGKPILYTSADSVLQIAAHEEVIPIEQLYAICEAARKHADGAQIGRVIARPFIGEPGSFKRTARRHDYSMKPPRTVLDALSDSGVSVVGVGKISDIFAGQGVTQSFPTASNAEGMARMAELWKEQRDGLIFANLVDFDMLFGHRRDVTGYAAALEEFDAWLGPFLSRVTPDDLVIITADHGNDPTFRGTDHTREQVPLFVLDGSESRDLGTRETFADVAATLAAYFGVPNWPTGTSFLRPASV
ncbi:MAG TPA: phosphopentomutase [Chthoniobacterales bacterium]|nr:phosphopentomutase [Chthoniobacterales bacterium]